MSLYFFDSWLGHSHRIFFVFFDECYPRPRLDIFRDGCVSITFKFVANWCRYHASVISLPEIRQRHPPFAVCMIWSWLHRFVVQPVFFITWCCGWIESFANKRVILEFYLYDAVASADVLYVKWSLLEAFLCLFLHIFNLDRCVKHLVLVAADRNIDVDSSKCGICFFHHFWRLFQLI